jgi:hypothetical protein
MEARELIAQYTKFEAKYGGANAPVAMLAWCKLAKNGEDERCQLLAQALEKLLADRCIEVWRAERDGEDTIPAYQHAANTARRMIHTAGIIDENAGVIED